MTGRQVPVERRIDDPTVLRAVAHPTRVRLLGLLRRDGPSTATLLGQRVGESSGSTSYHLRELERYGFVVDVPGRGTGRERWWRAAQRMTSWDTAEVLTREGGPEVVEELVHLQLRIQSRLLSSLAEQHAGLDPATRDAVSLNDWALRLSPASSRELVRELGAVLDRWTAEREEPGEAVFTVLLDGFSLAEDPLL